ncbi:MAG: RBBP9/YdeN family alpha/beta hydrolase [Myxococcaceae bacterium]
MTPTPASRLPPRARHPSVRSALLSFRAFAHPHVLTPFGGPPPSFPLDLLRRFAVSFSSPPAPTEPDRAIWVSVLERHLDDARGDPVLFVAHSLGCWAVDHLLAKRGAEGITAALLVAPPSPLSIFEPIQGFLPPPMSAEAWRPLAARSLLVGSDNDDYIAPDELESLANQIHIPLKLIPGAGHLNTAAGFGPFPLALEWVRKTVGAVTRW